MKYKVIFYDNKLYEYFTERKPFTVERLINLLMHRIEAREEHLQMFIDGYHEDQKIIEKLEKEVKEKVYLIR